MWSEIDLFCLRQDGWEKGIFFPRSSIKPGLTKWTVFTLRSSFEEMIEDRKWEKETTLLQITGYWVPVCVYIYIIIVLDFERREKMNFFSHFSLRGFPHFGPQNIPFLTYNPRHDFSKSRHRFRFSMATTDIFLYRDENRSKPDEKIQDDSSSLFRTRFYLK